VRLRRGADPFVGGCTWIHARDGSWGVTDPCGSEARAALFFSFLFSFPCVRRPSVGRGRLLRRPAASARIRTSGR
jgi:hypothetical protein